MAALDLTTFTLTNPSALITNVDANSVAWSGVTSDGGATRLTKTIPATNGGFSASLNLEIDAIQSYRFVFPVARTGGNYAPDSADPEVLAYYVRAGAEGSDVTLYLGYNVGGVIAESAPIKYSSSLVTNNKILTITLGYDQATEELTLSTLESGAGFESKVVTLGSVPAQEHNTLIAFSSKSTTSSDKPWQAVASSYEYEGLAPAVSVGVTSSTSVTATLPVTGTDGAVFAVAVGPTGSATAPTGPQIEAGTDGGDAAAIGGSTPVTAAGDIDVALTGLTANTAYTIHVVHEAADGTYGPVTSTTVTPNPILADNLDLDETTPYSAGGNVVLVMLDPATHERVFDGTVTPAADGTWSILAAGAAASTEYLVLTYADDRSLIGADWLTTGP